ncbi:MAG: Coenzyme F420 hydrogenase/dehydrogenase, beta subunit C-terminal domain [Vescimonas sp.]
MLFSGTPCQVDGLYHYLGEHPEKLLTCDVLCRGVCSPGVWAKLVQSMAYIKRKQPVAVQFCGKLPGQRERRFQVRFDDGTTFDSPLSKSEFGRGFSETSSCARPVTPVPMPPWTGPAICRWEHSAACLRTPTPRSSAAVSPCCW